jgi:hypothetical protein
MKSAFCFILLCGVLLLCGCGPNMGAAKGSSIYEAAVNKKCQCGEISKDLCKECPEREPNNQSQGE